MSQNTFGFQQISPTDKGFVRLFNRIQDDLQSESTKPVNITEVWHQRISGNLLGITEAYISVFQDEDGKMCRATFNATDWSNDPEFVIFEF